MPEKAFKQFMSVQLPSVENQPRMRRSTHIANQLREMIFSGALKPGDRLPTEEQLCKHFSVSRTTLRESVQMLRVSGLLDVTPGRGSFVRLPDLASLLKDLALYGRYASNSENEVMNLRQLLQVEAVRKACEAPLEKRKKLHTLLVTHQGEAGSNESVERQWNMMIAEIGGGRIMATLLEALLCMNKAQRLHSFENHEFLNRILALQIRLNAAILEGDGAMAARLMTNYLNSQRTSASFAA